MDGAPAARTPIVRTGRGRPARRRGGARRRCRRGEPRVSTAPPDGCCAAPVDSVASAPSPVRGSPPRGYPTHRSPVPPHPSLDGQKLEQDAPRAPRAGARHVPEAAPRQRGTLRGPVGHPGEGVRHLAVVDLGRGPWRGRGARGRARRPRLPARRQARGDWRQPAPALLVDVRRPGPRRGPGADCTRTRWPTSSPTWWSTAACASRWSRTRSRSTSCWRYAAKRVRRAAAAASGTSCTCGRRAFATTTRRSSATFATSRPRAASTPPPIRASSAKEAAKGRGDGRSASSSTRPAPPGGRRGSC